MDLCLATLLFWLCLSFAQAEPPAFCNAGDIELNGSWIIEYGEDSSGTVCNELSRLCRSYAHFIFVVSATQPLQSIWAGSMTSVDGGAWQPIETSQMILEQLHLPANRHSMVFSIQYDRMVPHGALAAPKEVCATAWFKDLQTSSCGHLAPLCSDMGETVLERKQIANHTPLGSYRFGNWSTICDMGLCRVMGHHALNIIPRFPSVTPVSVFGEVAWTDRNETPPEHAWLAGGKCNFLSVFDVMYVSGTEVRSQRFHCGFNHKFKYPLAAYACVRFSATDDSTGDSLPVDMSVGRGGTHVENNARCFGLGGRSLERGVQLV